MYLGAFRASLAPETLFTGSQRFAPAPSFTQVPGTGFFNYSVPQATSSTIGTSQAYFAQRAAQSNANAAKLAQINAAENAAKIRRDNAMRDAGFIFAPIAPTSSLTGGKTSKAPATIVRR